MTREYDTAIEIIESLDNVYRKMVDLYGKKKASEYFIKRCKLIGKCLEEAENVKKAKKKNFS